MNRIATLRKEHGLMQKDLAASLHIAQNTLSQYETGTRPVPPSIAHKIAEKFNVTDRYVYGYNEVPAQISKEMQSLLGEYAKNITQDNYQAADELHFWSTAFFKRIVEKYPDTLQFAANCMETSAICFDSICHNLEDGLSIEQFIIEADKSINSVKKSFEYFVLACVKGMVGITAAEKELELEIQLEDLKNSQDNSNN